MHGNCSEDLMVGAADRQHESSYILADDAAEAARAESSAHVATLDFNSMVKRRDHFFKSEDIKIIPRIFVN